MRRLLALALAAISAACLMHVPPTPEQRAADHQRAVRRTLADGPGDSDDDPRRLAFETLWAHELDFARNADTIGWAIAGRERTNGELAELCPMNASAASALANAYSTDAGRRLAHAVEVVLRFGAHEFSRCEAFAREPWRAILEASAKVAREAPLLSGNWIAAASGHHYALVVGKLHGIFGPPVNGVSHRRTLVVRGWRVVGQDTRIEAYRLRETVAGLTLTPEFVTRNVVEYRDDQAIVLDEPPRGHSWDGLLGDQPTSVVLFEIHGVTTYMPDTKPIRALAARAIAIGTPEHWNWVTWSPR